jgi:HAD superfamily hydrolase (TIGR01509 family)
MTFNQQQSLAGVEILILDVHGVLFNKPLAGFLRDLGERTGEGGTQLLDRWQREVRTPFWIGELDEAAMWKTLAPYESPVALRDDFEARFERGPLWGLATTFERDVWLLSNHRSDWLHERLARFDIADRFDRIMVSDEMAAAKPDPAAFRIVAEVSQSRQVLFLDDQLHNVQAADRRGIPAALVTGEGSFRTLPKP